MSHGRRSSGRPSRIALLFALAITTATGFVASPAFAGQFDGGLALSSDYVVHGVTRSRGHSVVQGQLGYTTENGWSLGTWFSTVDFTAGPGISRELDFYLARRWSLGRSLALVTEVTQYTFDEPAGDPSYDYTELRLALSFREMLEFSASMSPDYSGYSRLGPGYEQKVYVYAVAARRPLTHWLTVNVGAGHKDVSRLFGERYSFWSAGGELSVGRFDLAVTYIATDNAGQDLFGWRADDRVVATLALRIP